CRDEAIGVERIAGETIGVVAGEHKLELDILGVADGLQRLLDAEAARVRLLRRGAFLVLRPVRELTGAEAAHAVDLVLADLQRILRRDEDQRRIRRAQRLGEALVDPGQRPLAVMRRQIDDALARAHFERREVIADRLDRIGHLPLGALLQLVEEVVAHRRGVEASRAEAVEIDVAVIERQQLALPGIGDRALLGQERPRAELKGHRAELAAVEPVRPFAQAPHAARHEDRRLAEPVFAHELAQLADARIRRFRPLGILAVREAVMAAGEPGILIDDAAQPIAELVIGALPQRAEGAARGDDRVIVDAVAGADLGDAIGHAGAASDAVDEPARAFEHAMQDALGRRHLPQHVHMYAAAATAALIGDARLLDAAGDRKGDQLLMPLAPRAAVIDLRDAAAIGIIGIGVDAGERADAAAGRPGTRALAVRNRDAFAALDERQHLATGNDQRLQSDQDFILPPRWAPNATLAPMYAARPGYSNGTRIAPCHPLRAVAEDRLDPPGKKLGRTLRQIDGIGEKRQSRLAHRAGAVAAELALIGMKRAALERRRLLPPIGAERTDEKGPRQLRRRIAGRGEGRRLEARNQRRRQMRRPAFGEKGGGGDPGLALRPRRRLQLDHRAEIELAQEVDRLLEARHGLADEIGAEPRAGVEAPDLVEGQRGGGAAAIRRAVERIVMQENTAAVAREPHIELDPSHVQRGCDTETGKRVLRRRQRRAAMANDTRPARRRLGARRHGPALRRRVTSPPWLPGAWRRCPRRSPGRPASCW